MKISSPLFVAAILVGVLVVVAGGVWAVPVFCITTPTVSNIGVGGDGEPQIVGITELTCYGCIFEASILEGDTLKITFNIPPGVENMKINKLDTSATSAAG